MGKYSWYSKEYLKLDTFRNQPESSQLLFFVGGRKGFIHLISPGSQFITEEA